MFLMGGAVISGYSGFKWYQINKSPDFAYLDAHKELIADLAETIIPRTDTPGAKDAMANEGIITLLKNVANTKTQNNFIEGLKDVEIYSTKTFDKKFTALSQPQQNEVVKHFYLKDKNFDGKLGKAKNKILGISFFDALKYYTTIAFCTSKPGATSALAFDFIPGNYIGCVDLSPNQRSWATK